MNKFDKVAKMLGIIFTIMVWIVPKTAAAIEYENMMVGESKTLYLPSSVTTLRLKSVTYLSYGVDCVDVESYTNFSVRIKAKKKTPSAGVIVRCNYYYYILRNGTYVYGGIGAYDWNVKVSGVDPTSVSLPAEVNMKRGESKLLQATLTPSNATTDLTWESSAYAIVNISQNGEILAQHDGTSVVTVTTSNGKKAQCRVTVGTPEVVPTSVSISGDVSPITVGDVLNLCANVLPSNTTNKTVTWSSSDPSVITVNASTGQIKGMKSGYSYITVSTSNGITNSTRIECKDKVKTLTLDDATGIEGTLPSVANITYERRFLKGWNTMCLPFAVTQTMLNKSSKGLRMAIVKDIEVEGDKRNIVLQSVDNVKAGQSCLVFATEDVSWSVSLTSVTLVSAPLSTSSMKGSFTSQTIGSGYLKIADDGNSFGRTKTESAKVYPFRCYIIQ